MRDRKILYHTECGCIVERSGLINGSAALKRRLVCKKHGGVIVAKSCKCSMCGSEIILYGSTGRLPSACIKCVPSTKSTKENLLDLLPEELEILSERVDCIYRSLCIEVNIHEKKLPCIDCPDYKKHNGNFLTDNCLIDLKLLDKTIMAIQKMSDPEKQTRFDLDAFHTWGAVYDKRKRDLQASVCVKPKRP